MTKTRIKLNKQEVNELLKSPEMQAVCLEQAEKVRSRCGTGYAADCQVHGRVVARVWPDSAAARKDNYTNNTILKALK